RGGRSRPPPSAPARGRAPTCARRRRAPAGGRPRRPAPPRRGAAGGRGGDGGSYVGPVEAHAERVGGDHELRAALRKRPLGALARAAGEPGVIHLGAPAEGGEAARPLLRALPRGGGGE